jgi:carboxymethylenebutenolidase
MKQISLGVSDNTKMVAYVYGPDSAPRGAIIVLQEAFGVNGHIKDIAKNFSEQGYLAIAPELFHRTAPVGFTAGYEDFKLLGEHFGAITVLNIQIDTEACYEWIKKQGIKKVAAIGYCLGGRAAFLANAYEKIELNCAISYYGGRIAPAHLNLSEHQRSPILFFWGMLDQHIPNDQVQSLNESLNKHSKKYSCVQISDADHGFFCNERSSYHPKAARESWAHTLQFIEDNFTAF